MSDPNLELPPKLQGFAHLAAATHYTAAGAARAWQEAAFRHEVFAFVAILAIYWLVGASLIVYCAALILFLSVLAVEALNTAIEEIVDRVSPEFSTTGRHAKDLGSFAVGCMLCANGLLLAHTVVTRLIWA